MSSKNLDQYYTKKEIAEQCYKMLIEFISDNNLKETRFLEPSAGTGAFYDLLPKNNRLGIDIDPKIDEIIPYNFLDYSLPFDDYITIGNPPFGKNSSLAIKFFNKSAKHSSVIAFIVPKTFKKDSVVNRLDKFFELKFEYDLPIYSFEFESKDYDVPCVFQIWIKCVNPREKINGVYTHNDFSFITKELADFAIQRVGVNAGAIKENFTNCSSSSHYFIKCSPEILDTFKMINWDTIKYNTAGNPSISKTELINLYNTYKTQKVNNV